MTCCLIAALLLHWQPHIPMEEKTTESNGAVLGDELLMGREKMQRAR